MLAWLFGATEAEAKAKSLASAFMAKIPAAQTREAAPEASRHLRSASDDLIRQARQFGLEHKLGLYKKAKFCNVLKWELKDMGYADDLIDGLIKDMLIAMAQKK